MANPYRGIAFAVLLCVLGAHSGERGAEVHPLEPGDLGEARKPIVSIWTHTDGAPRGQEVSIRLPDGEREAVDRIVTRKKIDLAAHELHHASVIAKQEKERKKLTDEADESAATKNKIAETALDRAKRIVKDDQEALSVLQAKKVNAVIKNTEAKASVQTSGKKGKKKALAKARLTAAVRKRESLKVTKMEQKLDKAKYNLVGAKADAASASDAAGKARLIAVAQHVKWQSAEHAKLHAQFMKLKSKNMRKLALARFARENWRKKTVQARQDVRTNQAMVAAMGTSPGAKATKVVWKRSKERMKKATKKWLGARKNVGKTKTKIETNQKKWQRKMAYKAVSKTAKQGSIAWKAEKAFTAAISHADKMAKKMVADQASKALLRETKNAEKATAAFEHAKFAATMGKKERKREAANERKRKAKRKKLAAKRLADERGDKKAMKKVSKRV